MPGLLQFKMEASFQNGRWDRSCFGPIFDWVLFFICVCSINWWQYILNWVLMECNIIKTNSFISFGSIYYYWSLGNCQKFELGWFSCLYILWFLLQLLDWTTLPLMYDGFWISIIHWGQGSWAQKDGQINKQTNECYAWGRRPMAGGVEIADRN